MTILLDISDPEFHRKVERIFGIHTSKQTFKNCPFPFGVSCPTCVQIHPIMSCFVLFVLFLSFSLFPVNEWLLK